jgi:hypothetical protein
MLHKSKIFLALILLMCFHGSIHLQNDRTPISVDGTEVLTKWDYEMQSWWPPFIHDDEIWLVYGEWNFGNQQILKVRTYNGEWSTPQILTTNGEFITHLESVDGLVFFWIETTREESELIETICQRTFKEEWSPPSCSVAEPNVGAHFMVETPEGVKLVWSRSGSWEYQLYRGGEWEEKQVLTTLEGYRRLLRVIQHGDALWVFFETGTSDISYRVFNTGEISESKPLVTEGFPYMYSVLSYGNTLMVFLEVQDAEYDGKTLAYTAYDREWSPLQAVAGPEDGYLSGGFPLVTEDGRLFVFWNGSEKDGHSADLYYRIYDGAWSRIFRLTDTPDLWETACTMTEYHDELLFLWREKDSHLVYATTAHETGASNEYGNVLRQVSLREEPPEPIRNSLRIQNYIAPLLIVITIVVIGMILIMKRQKSDQPRKKRQKK